MSVTSFAGPFPTDFSSPPECATFTANSIVGLDFAWSCLPEDFNTDPAVYYSPGTACPAGYTALDDCTRATDSVTTTLRCCPVRRDLTMWCVTNPGSRQSAWTDMDCTWSAGIDTTVITYSTVLNGRSTFGSVTMEGGQGVNAYGLRMIYETSDLVSDITTSTPTSRQTSETSEASTQGVQSGSPNPEGEISDQGISDQGGLSTGATVAIAVVIPLVVIAALVGAWLWYRRRNKPQQSSFVPFTQEPKTMPHVPRDNELYGSHPMPQEMFVGRTPQELSSERPPQELHSTALKFNPAAGYWMRTS